MKLVRLSIRRRLLAVAMLGGVACILALFAIWPLGSADRQRLARARAGVVDELQRLRQAPAGETLTGVHIEGPLEVRSGFIDSAAGFDRIDPPLWKDSLPMLRDAVARAEAGGGSVTLDARLANGIVVVGATHLGGTRFAWAADLMRLPRWGRAPSVVGTMLGLVSLVLVIATLQGISSVQRGASSLKRSLSMLRADLAAPIQRPADRELSEVADGIASLATELAQTQKALAERERLAVLGRVSAGIAHELRNPLASIKLQIDLLRRQHDAAPEMAGKLDDVVEEIARLDRLVNDLLTIAVRRTGPRRETDLRDLVHRRADLMKPVADERGVTVEIEGNASARIDTDSIARVVDNLVRNAIEIAPEGSKVCVELAGSAGGTRLRVRDRGPGVPDDRKHELFEPFFTTKQQGVGLGLALSRAIASAHGGTLEYSREDETTVFELSLPGTADPS